MNTILFRTGALLMALAVILGALGAHSLERMLSPDLLDSFETGVRYHIYHSLTLLIIAGFYQHLSLSYARWASRLMLIGVACFSGSIYLFTFGHLFSMRLAGHLWWITPLGGILLIAGWLTLFFGTGVINPHLKKK